MRHFLRGCGPLSPFNTMTRKITRNPRTYAEAKALYDATVKLIKSDPTLVKPRRSVHKAEHPLTGLNECRANAGADDSTLDRGSSA